MFRLRPRNTKDSNKPTTASLICSSTCLWLCLWFSLIAPTTVFAQGDTDPATEPSSSQPSIAIETDTATDAAIKARLEGIYSALAELDEVSVSVDNGVVTLNGDVLTSKSRDNAEQIANQLDSVVEVVNNLALERDVGIRLDNSIDQLADSSRSFVSTLPTALLALAIVVMAWFAGRFFAKHRPGFNRVAPNAFIAQLLGNVVWLAILAMGVFAALTLLDATELIGTVLGAAGIFGLALGFAVRDTVENYIASILLSLRNPFKSHDYISIDSYEGSVARLTSRATVLISAEGNHIRIPNAIVYKSIIINYTRNPQRRFEFKVGIDAADDIIKAQGLAQNTLNEVPGILADPAPVVTVDELSDSSTSLKITAWLDQRKHSLVKVRSESIRVVKATYDQAGIVMPEPIYRVLVDEVPDRASLIGANDAIEADPLQVPTDGAAFLQQNKSATQDTTVDNAIVETLNAESAGSSGENLLSEHSKHE